MLSKRTKWLGRHLSLSDLKLFFMQGDLLLITSLLFYLIIAILLHQECPELTHANCNHVKGLWGFTQEGIGAFYFPFIIISYITFYLNPLPKLGRMTAVIVPLLIVLWGIVGVEGWLRLTVGAIASFSSILLLIIAYQDAMRNDISLVHSVLRTISRLAIVGILSGSGSLLLVGLVESTIALFELAPPQSMLTTLYLFIPMVVAPLLYRFFDLRREGEEGTSTPFVQLATRILLDYIIAPATLLYAMLLGGYLLFVLARGIIPQGIVVYNTLALYALGLVLGCSRFTADTGSHLTRLLANGFKWITLLLIPLYAWAVYVRIAEYSFTEARVYLVLIGAVLLLGSIALFVAPHWVYRTFALSTLLFVALPTFLPSNITPLAWSLRAQEWRMLSLLKEHNLLDQNGKIIAGIEEQQLMPPGSPELRKIDESYLYLELHSALPSKQLGQKSWDSNYTLPVDAKEINITVKRGAYPIPIEEYSEVYHLHQHFYSTEIKKEAAVTINEKNLTYPIPIETIRDQMISFKERDLTLDTPFVVRDGDKDWYIVYAAVKMDPTTHEWEFDSIEFLMLAIRKQP